MKMPDAKTILNWTTKYSADSIEWCPIEEYHSIFVCGTYQLQKDEEEIKEDGEDKKVKNQKRLGILYLFHVTSRTTNLEPIQTLETSAILDQKWCDNSINGFPHLAVANAAGFLQIYKLTNHANFRLELVTEYELNQDDKILALSLDWSTRNNPSQTPKIVISDSSGCVHVCTFGSEGKISKASSRKAHDYEAWICAFNCWDPSVIITEHDLICFGKSSDNLNRKFAILGQPSVTIHHFDNDGVKRVNSTVRTGGDDCMMKMFDLRCDNTVTKISRSHEAGVTSLHCNNKIEHLFSSGSYDEKLRLWDSRKLNNPIVEEALGGGIWRLKWDPFQQDILLAACMYGGFRIVHCKDNYAPKIIIEYNEHESIAYGADWCHDRALYWEDSEAEKFQGTIATCSFYDCKVNVVKIKY